MIFVSVGFQCPRLHPHIPSYKNQAFHFPENLDCFPKGVNSLLAVSSPAACNTGVAAS